MQRDNYNQNTQLNLTQDQSELLGCIKDYIRDDDMNSLEEVGEILRFLQDEDDLDFPTNFNNNNIIHFVLAKSFPRFMKSEEKAQQYCQTLLKLILACVNPKQINKWLLSTNRPGNTPIMESVYKHNQQSTLLLNFIEQFYLTHDNLRDGYLHIIGARYDKGFTLLQNAIRFMRNSNFEALLAHLKKAYEQAMITKDFYRHLFVDDYCLHSCFKSDGTDENMRLYFKELRALYCEKILTIEDINHIFTKPNQASYTPLHQGLAKGNHYQLFFYMDIVWKLYEQGYLAREAFEKLLVCETVTGYTPLLAVLQTGDKDKVLLYKQHMCSAFHKKVITAAHYKSLLISTNEAGFTPLTQVLKQGNVDCLKIYFEALREAYEHKIVALDELELLFTQSNSQGLNPLHQAAFPGSVSVLNLFIDEMEYYFD